MILTEQEYTIAYNNLLVSFAKAQTEQRNRKVWALQPSGEKDLKATLLWLFSWALSTWEHEDGAYNYLTEVQVMQMLQHAGYTSLLVPNIENLKLTL